MTVNDARLEMLSYSSGFENFWKSYNSCGPCGTSPVSCSCQQTPTGVHQTQQDCLNDTTSCCYIPPVASYDCDPTTHTCYDPGNGSGVYSTLGQCQANCQPVLAGNCSECDNTLAAYINGPTTFVPYNAVATWLGFDQCVEDPIDGCCRCCVRDTNQLNNVPNSLINFTCKIQNGVYIDLPGYSIWMDCGVDINGNPTSCGPGGSGPGGSGPVNTNQPTICCFAHPALPIWLPANAVPYDCSYFSGSHTQVPNNMCSP